MTLKRISNGPVLDGLFLFANSEEHCWYDVREIFIYLIYPLMHNKIRFYYDESGKPVALYTYCFLSKEKSEAFLNEDYYLTEEDYIAEDGDELWGIEFIAPHGHIRKMFSDIKREYAEKYGKPRPIFWRRLSNPSKKRRGKL